MRARAHHRPGAGESYSRPRRAASQAATDRARTQPAPRRAVVVPGLRPAPDRGRPGPGGRGWRTSTATTTSTSTWASAPSSPATCHPIVRAAVEEQLDDGTLFVTPCEANADVAELLAERYGLPMWRFTNSGTEATMDAIRVARGVTGRDKIVKVEGGYHGHHDEVMISMKPPLDEAGPADRPTPVPATAGITRAVLDDTIVIPYNDPDALERVLAAGDVACFIVEPVMENIGICLPDAGYLAGGARDHPAPRHAADLRRGEDRHHRRLGRRHRRTSACSPTSSRWPSRSAAACPIGAFGGTAEVHGPITRGQGAAPRHVQRQPAGDGRRPRRCSRDICTPGGDRRTRSTATRGSSPPATPIIAERRLPAHTVQFGAKGCVTYSPSRSATTATTRRPTSTSPSPAGSGASTAASCCRRASTSSG